MKRLQHRKPSHLLLWDSHGSPKNIKWFNDNLEAMDESVKRMLYLIEDDGDSLAKKVGIYYQKRPQLISQVQEFQCMYQSLAERYDHLVGELRKTIPFPPDLHSPNLGMSDNSSGSPFFSSGGSSLALNQREGDESSSLTDSDHETDDSVKNYSNMLFSGSYPLTNRRISELEAKPDEVKQNSKNATATTHGHEHDLKLANDRIQLLEQEISCLSCEIQKQKSSGLPDQQSTGKEEVGTWKTKPNGEKREFSRLQERNARLKASLLDRDREIRELKMAISDTEQKIFPEKAQIKAEIARLLDERSVFEEQIRESELHARSLEDQIRNFKSDKQEQERGHELDVEQLKEGLTNKDSEIDELKAELVILREKVVERDEQNSQMCKQLQQLDMKQVGIVSAMEEVHKHVGEQRMKAKNLEAEIENQRNFILGLGEEKREAIRQLCFVIEYYRNRYLILLQASLGHKRTPLSTIYVNA